MSNPEKAVRCLAPEVDIHWHNVSFLRRQIMIGLHLDFCRTLSHLHRLGSEHISRASKADRSELSCYKNLRWYHVAGLASRERCNVLRNLWATSHAVSGIEVGSVHRQLRVRTNTTP